MSVAKITMWSTRIMKLITSFILTLINHDDQGHSWLWYLFQDFLHGMPKEDGHSKEIISFFSEETREKWSLIVRKIREY